MPTASGVQKTAGVRMLFVCFFLITLQASSAFLFNFNNILRPRQQVAQRPIDAECVAKSRRGDCRFYKCFNDRHNCGGSNNYALDYGWRFCHRFDSHLDELTAEGQRWLNGTRICAMERMLEMYRADAISCHQVDREMKENQAACAAENGLCHGRLLAENKDVFSDVYSLNHRSAVRFLQSVKQCTAQKFREAATWFSEQMHNVGEIGQSVLPFFQDLEQRVEQLTENIQGEFSHLRDTVQQLGRAFGSRNSNRTTEDAE